MKHLSFDATISALDAETSAFGAATSAIAQRSFDAETSALDAHTSALGTSTSAVARSYRRYWRGVSGDCGVGITLQMCNRVTNHGDMSTFPNLPHSPFGNYLPLKFPETELLQSPFRMEFSMGSLMRKYQRSLRHHCRFLRSYC